MSKKLVSLIAMAVSALFVLFGILTMAGALGGDTGYASSSYMYDSGYSQFGADFYTYVSNNAAEAASASRTVAANLDDIAELLKSVFGIFMIGFGLLSLCHFALIWLGEKKAQEETVVATYAEEETATAAEPDAPIEE